MGRIRVSAAVNRFLRWAEKNLSPGTVAGYRHYLTKFRRHSKNVLLTSLTPAKLTSWSTRWHALQAVQRLVLWCHREAKLIRSNPIAGLKLPPLGQRSRVLSPGESAQLLRLADASLRALLIGLRESFARPGELRIVTFASIRRAGDLPWTRGSLEAGDCFFFLPNGKGYRRRKETSSFRVIPITPRLGRLILRLADRRGDKSDYVFKRDASRSWRCEDLRQAMRRLRRAACLGANWRGEKIVAYTFRHTAATRAVAAGVRDFMLAEIMGHASTRTTRRYVHLQPDMIREAMRIVIEAKTRIAKKKTA